jgi:hypothetical protein
MAMPEIFIKLKFQHKNMSTYYYSKKLSVTDSQQKLELPRLRGVNIINSGSSAVLIEFENDIDTDSVLLPPYGTMKVPADMLDIRYKCASASETSTLYIYGLRHEKA